MKVSKSSIVELLVMLFVCLSPVFAQSDRGGITGKSNGSEWRRRCRRKSDRGEC
jgi:hypothetical protein